jgi:aspartate aminotransferase
VDHYIKKNITNLKPSATLAINEKVKNLLKDGKKVFNFGFGQSPFPIPDKIVNVLKENAHKKDYLPMQGLPELREAISKYLFKRTGVNYKKENIIITPGSKEAMLLMHVVFNGEIILPAPSWVSYEPQAEIAKNKVHWIETSIDNNWFPTAKQLDDKIKSIGKKNIILILNSPNNPSGSVCNNLVEIAKIAKQKNIKILSDEIYTDLTFDGNYESISKFYPENTFISGGLSKWCGAGGWRLGFFAVPNTRLDFLNALKTLASESYSTVNSPLQFAAVEAYKGDYSVYLNKTKSILKLVGNYVFNNLKSNKVLINPPEGAFYLMPEFLNSKFKTSSEMCDDILNKSGVALLPGSDFGFKSNKMLARLSYTDFDGNLFLKNLNGSKKLDNDLIKEYAPNVVEGIEKLAEWSKSL